MINKLENVLFINTGGGIGDALSSLVCINFINKNFSIKNFFYYSTDLEKFWFDNKLSEFKPKNLITIKNFPQHFGFLYEHRKVSKKLINLFNFDKFDLIIDNQTRLKNSLIYKKIPHQQYISPCVNFLLSKPFILTKKNKNVTLRLINYFNRILKKSNKPGYEIKIEDKFINTAKKIMSKNNKYIGFSITAGHPTRNKEFEIKEIIKVANYYAKNYTPTFFIEEKFNDLKKLLKKEIKNVYFPEELVDPSLRKPMIVTALGSLTEFNISIDNGISHMLSFSQNKNFIFYNDRSEKFKPAHEKNFVYDCKLNNTKIDSIKSEEIIRFINKN